MAIWVLKISEPGQTAGLSLWCHLPFGAMLVHVFEPQSHMFVTRPQWLQGNE